MSASYGAVYARVPEGGVAALEAAIIAARTVSKHSSPLGVLCFDPARHIFALVDRWGESDNMPIWAEEPDLGKAFELVALSRSVGEVLAFHTIDEGLSLGLYGVWKDGALIRDLQWIDGRWVRAEGLPHPWEDALYTEKEFQNALELADDPAPVRAAFELKKIIVETSWPMPSALSSSIWQSNKGPAGGFQPWPRRDDVVAQLRARDSTR